MSLLTDKERRELRRKAFELPLEDGHLIAIGYVAVRAAMLDNLIDLTFEDLIVRYPQNHPIRTEKGVNKRQAN